MVNLHQIAPNSQLERSLISSHQNFFPDRNHVRDRPLKSDYSSWISRMADDLLSENRTILPKFKFGKPHFDSIEDLLHAAGVDETCFNSNAWDFVQSIQKNPQGSKSTSFIVKDTKGQEWFMKLNQDEKRAEIEASANYLLSKKFDFIVPGAFQRPIVAGDYFVTAQKLLCQSQSNQKSLEYWLTKLGKFHDKAANILEESGVKVGPLKYVSADELYERFLQGGGKRLGIKFDKVALAESIEYLSENSYHSAVHGDIKSVHFNGIYLIDNELIGKAHPGVDIGPLFAIKAIERSLWRSKLDDYLNLQSQRSEGDLDLLLEGTVNGHCYMAHKEIASSLMRGYVGDRVQLIKSVADVY